MTIGAGCYYYSNPCGLRWYWDTRAYNRSCSLTDSDWSAPNRRSCFLTNSDWSASNRKSCSLTDSGWSASNRNCSLTNSAPNRIGWSPSAVLPTVAPSAGVHPSLVTLATRASVLPTGVSSTLPGVCYHLR